jgi:23S rRNA pseudouridine2605 synthase
VETREKPSLEALRRIEMGIFLDGEKTAPARVLEVQSQKTSARLRVVISEGRKRQIKKMFGAVGHPVINLSRVRIGGLKLGKLPAGSWRDLQPGEIRALVGKHRGE